MNGTFLVRVYGTASGIVVLVSAIRTGEPTPRFPAVRTEIPGASFSEVGTTSADRSSSIVAGERMEDPGRKYVVRPNAAGNLRFVVDYGTYRCDWSDPWGNSYSETFVLPVEIVDLVEFHAGDFDANGFVNGEDYDRFVEAFAAGTPDADFDENGFVNGEDFDAFSVAYDRG